MYNPFKNITARWFSSITEINKKYKTPRVTMTPGVKFALLILRVYLLLLLLLIFYKFFTLVK
jgi:hypothetical protein